MSTAVAPTTPENDDGPTLGVVSEPATIPLSRTTLMIWRVSIWTRLYTERMTRSLEISAQPHTIALRKTLAMAFLALANSTLSRHRVGLLVDSHNKKRIDRVVIPTDGVSRIP